MSAGRIIEYLISLTIGVGTALGSYWGPLSFILPEVIIGLFCFILKKRYRDLWDNKMERFLCLGFLISGNFAASMLMNFHFYQHLYAHSIILVSFFWRFFFGFIFYPIAIAVSIYATDGIKGWRRILAVIISSIFILWPGPLFTA